MRSFINHFSFLFTCFCLIILTSCRRDCNDKDVLLGQVDHNEITIAFIHYTDGQTITFENSDGIQNTFTVIEDQELDERLCVEVTCRPAFEDEGENSCNYYSADANHFVLMNNDHSLYFRTGIETFQPETELFYEYIEIGVIATFDTLSAGIITTNNFSSVGLSASNTILENNLIFQDSTIVGSLSDVYAYANADNDLYLVLDREKGIVEYKLEGQVWQLNE